MKNLIILFTFLTSAFLVKAQMVNPTKWSFDFNQNGRDVELIFKASIDEGWHLYDTDLAEGGPISTTITYTDSSLFDFVGKLKKNPMPEKHFDESFQMEVGYFSGKAVLTQNIRLHSDNPVTISGNVLFMSCNDENCTPPEESDFSFKINQKNVKPVDNGKATDNSNLAGSLSSSGKKQSLWLFLVISALAGLAAVLTPCVFPMIPMTVSFFMRGSENKSTSVRTGLFFGISIVFIFTLLGALFSIGLFGPNIGSLLSTHWIPNLLFFVLFMVFAISFFGAFEIVLPSSLVNKTDAKADKGGLVGAFFMALTTVIVSFSCTGPFIGALIIEAIQGGGLRPLIGMFVFGLAFATPFTLLAIFPSALSKMPKSGAWLNAIKVVFAFVLLAFGFKFLSNIDQVYGFELLNREIYLVIWIVIFSFLGLYFLGKIKFSHDSDLPYLSVGRLFLAIVTFVFVGYLFTGLLGAPLASVSALLPPQTEKAHYNSTVTAENKIAQELCGEAKYADKLHLPHGLAGYFDLEQGLACAKEQGKPVFLVFKGHACSNCKKMENTVWNNPEVLSILAKKYVIIGLYTDDRTKMSQEEMFTSKLDGKIKDTLGEKNLDILISKYKTNTIPYHVIIKPDGTESKMDVTFDKDEFKNFIVEGLE
ncbi:MAG: disulfide bond formation protein DsbD [Draconibacterium sp.]|nr:MAG: disulfide bond formation protein DsbD [Draconibacterium sp.]